MTRRAHIYMPEEDMPAFLVPLDQAKGGFVVERRDFTVLTDWRDPIKLATALRATLEKFAVKDHDLRGRGKPTDNPLFQASKCRTVSEFEGTYLFIGVAQYGDRYLARVTPRYEKDIYLETILNMGGLEVDIGTKLLRLFDMSVKWSGII